MNRRLSLGVPLPAPSAILAPTLSAASTHCCPTVFFSKYFHLVTIEWTHKRKNSHYISMIR
ncbi:hypothetical protein D1AOALGA4SA_12226 [Olavius algarvensis Delta 1 endosymbiont]|nr:hypothetical protein D1AOALGA4SA_12226 [Olavius algarvensis Delta 1 endosymbiont]